MSEFKSAKVINSMGDMYAKVPSLPKGATDFLVVIVPWISLVFGALMILGSLSAFGLTAVFSPFSAMSQGAGFAASLMIIAVVGIAQGVLMLVAFPSLRKNKEKGWNLLFWSEILGLVSVIVGLSIGGVIGALIGFYFLFQIRSYYK